MCFVYFSRNLYLKSYSGENVLAVQLPWKLPTHSNSWNIGSTENFTSIIVVRIEKIYKTGVVWIFIKIYI